MTDKNDNQNPAAGPPDATQHRDALPAVATPYKNYLRYNSDGRIVAQCTITQDTQVMMTAGGARFLEGTADPLTNYVKDGVVTPRPVSGAVLNGMTITGLTPPCQVMIGSSLYDCKDDHIDLSFDEAGSHRVLVISWPCQDKEFTVEAAPQ